MYQFEKSLEDIPEDISLNKLVSQLIDVYQPVAVKHSNFIMNDVKPGFTVNTDKRLLAILSSELFRGALESSWNCCIRVAAKMYHDVVLLSLRSNQPSAVFRKTNANETKILAEKLGGYISMDPTTKQGNSITLIFINRMKAA